MHVHWLNLFSYFWSGVFLANAVPLFVSGIMGRAHQRPFAKSPGKGLSSSTVNCLGLFQSRHRLCAGLANAASRDTNLITQPGLRWFIR
jgi:hypothetical protein